MNQALDPFHLAIAVDDLQAARHFYATRLGCPEGRSAGTWIDFDLFGHQLVVHLEPARPPIGTQCANLVDGHEVPVPHFGVVLEWDRWWRFAERLRAQAIAFVIEPHIRFAGEVGEQATLFLHDPAGNALEFKSFKDRARLFAR